MEQNKPTARVIKKESTIGKSEKQYSGYAIELYMQESNEWIPALFVTLQGNEFIHTSFLEAVKELYDNGCEIIWV